LVKSIYVAAAREARAVGIHQLGTLVIEPNRDPRLGRNAEAFSEDPYLSSQIAREIVHGGQGESVFADEPPARQERNIISNRKSPSTALHTRR